MRRSRRWFILAALPLSGCIGDLRMLDASVGDASAPDLAGDLLPPSSTRFAPTIQSDLDALGCSTGGACHGGAAPMHLIAQATAHDDLVANYGEVQPRAAAGASSVLLRKPLQSSGLSHAGSQPFPSVSDPTYRRWLAWIEAGAPSGLDGVDAGVPDAAQPTDGGSDGDM
jgi:hypothetical protein